jgi:hypothetical protein
MKRIIKLLYKDKTYINHVHIDNIITECNLKWLDKCEIENAIIEIKDNKLYWHQGIFFYGDMKYCIWLNGIFRSGNFNGGVFYNGRFESGDFNGVLMNGDFNGNMLGEDRRKILNFNDFKI